MNKYTITETYTPHNRKQKRNTREVLFSFEPITGDTLETKMEANKALADAGLLAIGNEDMQEEVSAMDIEINGTIISFTITLDNGEYHYEIDIDTENVVEYSREAMVSWAETQVSLNPTYEEDVYNEDAKKYITTTKTNTVERLLSRVLLGWDFQVLMEEKANDLREIVTHLYEHGTKGYANMSRDELLDMIQDEIVEGCDCETVQDVLNTCEADDEDDE